MHTLWVTCKLALCTTLILLVLALPLAYWLAYTKFKLRPLVEAVVSMPMVLPPSVIGYYLLMAYSPNAPAGAWLLRVWGVRLAFTFEGILLASVIFSLPFMVQPLQNGLRQLPPQLREAAYTLGKGSWVTFFRILLPNIQTALWTAIALTFAHVLGEFGIVLMVGGNIPGETRVASIAIWDEVQALQYDAANRYALILLCISMAILTLLYSFQSTGLPWKKQY